MLLELAVAYRWTVAWWLSVGWGMFACAATLPRPFG